MGLGHIFWTGQRTGSLDHNETTITVQVLPYKPLFTDSEIELIHPAGFFPPSRQATLPPLRCSPSSYLTASAFVNDFKGRVNGAEHPGRRYPEGVRYASAGRYVAHCTFSSSLFFLSFMHSFWCLLMCPHK